MNLPKAFFHLLLALSWLLQAGAADAWGSLGHRVTGYVATALLTERAQQQIQVLLNDETLAAAATYMDVERKDLEQRWRESARWHYDNRPVCADRTPYCADGQCATVQIERFRKTLSDSNAPKPERALALKLLIHMLGDIHQPLHMADNADRGGNEIEVRLEAGGETHRLHEVFDTVLVKQLIGQQSAKRYAHRLLTMYGPQLKHWQQGSLSDWAQETHVLAVKRTYGDLPQFACNTQQRLPLELPPVYLQNARAYLPEQLTKAGARIAAILNSSFR